MDLGPFPTVVQGSISDQVYEILRERILSSYALPGERLKPAEIESQMGVSRTPLQQALNRLADEGLIEIVPRKGTYVVKPTQRDVEETFDVCSCLEAYAAQLAVHSITTAQCDMLCALVEQMAHLAQTEIGPQAQEAYAQLDERFHGGIVDASGNKHLNRLWAQVNAHVRIAHLYAREPDGQLALRTKEHAGIADAFVARDGTQARKLLERHIRRAKETLLSRLESLGNASQAA